MRPCVIVPHYRHETLVVPVLAGLARIGLPAIVVDDGATVPPARLHEALRQRLGAWLEGLE